MMPPEKPHSYENYPAKHSHAESKEKDPAMESLKTVEKQIRAREAEMVTQHKHIADIQAAFYFFCNEGSGYVLLNHEEPTTLLDTDPMYFEHLQTIQSSLPYVTNAQEAFSACAMTLGKLEVLQNAITQLVEYESEVSKKTTEPIGTSSQMIEDFFQALRTQINRLPPPLHTIINNTLFNMQTRAAFPKLIIQNLKINDMPHSQEWRNDTRQVLNYYHKRKQMEIIKGQIDWNDFAKRNINANPSASFTFGMNQEQLTKDIRQHQTIDEQNNDFYTQWTKCEEALLSGAMHGSPEEEAKWLEFLKQTAAYKTNEAHTHGQNFLRASEITSSFMGVRYITMVHAEETMNRKLYKDEQKQQALFHDVTHWLTLGMVGIASWTNNIAAQQVTIHAENLTALLQTKKPSQIYKIMKSLATQYNVAGKANDIVASLDSIGFLIDGYYSIKNENIQMSDIFQFGIFVLSTLVSLKNIYTTEGTIPATHQQRCNALRDELQSMTETWESKMGKIGEKGNRAIHNGYSYKKMMQQLDDLFDNHHNFITPAEQRGFMNKQKLDNTHKSLEKMYKDLHEIEKEIDDFLRVTIGFMPNSQALPGVPGFHHN